MTGIRLERSGPAATIVVDRPAARNALTAEMRTHLVETFEQLAADRSVRAVFVRGAGGRSFISGGDIKEFASASTEDFREMARQAELLYNSVERLPVPSVAVIEGAAFGAGFLIALACDLRVCTPRAAFALPIVRLGNCLSPGEFSRLVRFFGAARCRDLLLTAKTLSVPEADAWGMVTEVVEPEHLDRRLIELAEQLGSHAPISVRATKESISRLADGGVLGSDLMEGVWATHDFREGIAAFVEKRAPIWRDG